MAERRALVVATSDYEDPKLRELRAPGSDAQALTKVLGDPTIGAFDVATLSDPHEDELRRRISSFFRAAARDDFLLLHMACHGVKDDDGKLYFAASDTQLSDLAATAVRSDFVNEAMADSRCAQIVLLLDCCYSGAFSKGMTPRADSSVQLRDAFHGQGMAVLSASDSTEYAWEGDDVAGEGVSSVFTHAVVEGLQDGAADLNRDGQVSVDDLYEYVRTRLEREGSKQTPRKWSDLSGDLYIALNPRAGEEVTLPADLASAIENPIAAIRIGSIEELTRLASGRHVGYANAARYALERLATDDSRKVSIAAAAALESIQSVKVGSGSSEPSVIEPETDGHVELDQSDSVESQDQGGEPEDRWSERARRRKRLIGVAVGALAVAAVAIVVALFAGGGGTAPARTIGQVSDSSFQTLKVDVPSSSFGIGAGGVRESAVWALEPDGLFAYDPNFTGSTTRQVPLPGRPLDIGVNGGQVWVVTARGVDEPGWLVEVDPSDATVMDRIPFPEEISRVSVGHNFVWVLSADGSHLYRVGVSAPTPGLPIPTLGNATDVAVGPDSVFLIDTSRETLTKWSTTGKLEGARLLKSPPARVSAGGDFVWVTQPNSSSVTIVPSVSFLGEQVVNLGGRPMAVAYGDGAAWITDSSSPAVIRVSSDSSHNETRIPVDGKPLDVFASHVPDATTDTIYVLVGTKSGFTEQRRGSSPGSLRDTIQNLQSLEMPRRYALPGEGGPGSARS